MLPEDTITQPPVAPTAPDEAQTGVVSPQPEADTVVAEPGAEKETPSPKPARTYTQQEWAARESAKDKEVAQHRVEAAQMRQYYEAQMAQIAEAQAQTGDRGAVERGEITEAEVAQRAQQRQQAYQQMRAFEQRQAQVQWAAAQANEQIRFVAAGEMAREYGVEVKELLHESIQDFPTMKGKAQELKMERLLAELKAAKEGGGETYDSGQMGQVTGSVSSMSPGEKILYGLAHPPRKTK